MLAEYLKIPKQRVAVLIGTKGETKKAIEKGTKAKLEIDSSEGDVGISGQEDNWQGVMRAADIAKAIGRGFSPEHALLLLKEDYQLEMVDVTDFSGKSGKTLVQKRSRVIGAGGKAREFIEEHTGCRVSVFGKTVSIIGPAEKAGKARHAVEMLLGGARHKTVYDFLEREESGRGEFEL